jgi:hypothetical protein
LSSLFGPHEEPLDKKVLRNKIKTQRAGDFKMTTLNWREVFEDTQAASVEEAARRCPWRFATSASQLGCITDDRQIKGLEMTPWEAYQIFGLELIEEAREKGAAVLRLDDPVRDAERQAAEMAALIRLRAKN